jgi:hypothetical protein
MSKPRLLDAVARGLQRQGLPTADVARLLAELQDHVTDILTEEGSLMQEHVDVNAKLETRLGSPDLLVAAVVANRRQASFFGRHPVWSFVVAPIPLTLLCVAAFLFLGVGLAEAAGWLLGDRYALEGQTVTDWPAGLRFVVHAFVLAIHFLPVGAATLLLCWSVRRGGLSWKWTVTASALVAFVAWTLVVHVQLPEQPGGGRLELGLGVPIFQWMNLLQLLVPFAIAAAFLWGNRNRMRAQIGASVD